MLQISTRLDGVFPSQFLAKIPTNTSFHCPKADSRSLKMTLHLCLCFQSQDWFDVWAMLWHVGTWARELYQSPKFCFTNQTDSWEVPLSSFWWSRGKSYKRQTHRYCPVAQGKRRLFWTFNPHLDSLELMPVSERGVTVQGLFFCFCLCFLTLLFLRGKEWEFNE